ncbi:MAG: Uma2 family endonuclease [Gammaproteobacteria bacterium]|nr:Uma2 family endonuclease [Gammaproteobacteria bacterium]
MKKNSKHLAPGPFRVDQLHSGDPYELSDGHPILCMPAGSRASRANLLGGQVLHTDPDVEFAGLDTGFALSPNTLRAPDIAVSYAAAGDEPGWVQGAPFLAVEYVDLGQDEEELTCKIDDLLAAGTKFMWVVRLTDPRQVEIHEPGKQMRLALPGQTLQAPGVLRNPVAVLALYDQKAAHESVLKNLLQRQGYSSIEEYLKKRKEEYETPMKSAKS